MEENNVIVVGIICAGISAVYYWAKKGLGFLALNNISVPG